MAVLPPEGETHRQLKEIILSERPKEAVGFLTADHRIIPLVNHSDHPEDHFQVHRDEMLRALAREYDIVDLTFWHSHPSGGIGPSRTDMQQKIPLLHHLVVSIVNDDLVYTYY